MSTDEWGSPTDEAEVDFSLDGSGLGADDLGGGGSLDREGMYHFEVSDVVLELGTLSDSGSEKSPAIRFDLTVVQSVKNQSPAGSRHFHRIYVAGKGGQKAPEGSRNGALRFGLGLGILAEHEVNGVKSIVDAVTGSPKDIGKATWLRAKGCNLIVKIAMGKASGGFAAKLEIPYGAPIYLPNNPSVDDVPKNMEAWAFAANHSSQLPPPADTAKAGDGKKPSPEPPTTKVKDGQGRLIDPVDEFAGL